MSSKQVRLHNLPTHIRTDQSIAIFLWKMIELNKVRKWAMTPWFWVDTSSLEIPGICCRFREGAGPTGPCILPGTRSKGQAWCVQLILQYSNCDVNVMLEQHGLCRAVSYIVQTLTAESTFCLKLTTPLKAQVPQKWGTLGHAADFMINVSNTFVSMISLDLSR